MDFQDLNLQCIDCSQPFVFTAGEQQFYDRKVFKETPKRCKACREVRKQRKDAGGKKVFMLAHSHGGLMAVKWMGSHKVEGLSGLVLSAPYFKLAITPPALKLLAARAVGKLVPWLALKTELTVEDLSRDPEVQRATREDPLYLTIVTPRWFLESTKAQGEAMLLAPKIQAPLFVLCGAEDGVAAPAAARIFFEAAASTDKKFKEYPGMRHEPLNEVGRAEVFRDISGWISAHL